MLGFIGLSPEAVRNPLILSYPRLKSLLAFMFFNFPCQI